MGAKSLEKTLTQISRENMRQRSHKLLLQTQNHRTLHLVSCSASNSKSSQMATCSSWWSGPKRKVLQLLACVLVCQTVLATKSAAALYVPVPLNLSAGSGKLRGRNL